MAEGKLTKADIVDAVQEAMGLPRTLVAAVVDDMFELVKETLAAGESVKVSGFGRFEVRKKKDRRGRDPRTGEEIIIPGRNVLKFKPGDGLRKALRNQS